MGSYVNFVKSVLTRNNKENVETFERELNDNPLLDEALMNQIPSNGITMVANNEATRLQIESNLCKKTTISINKFELQSITRPEVNEAGETVFVTKLVGSRSVNNTLPCRFDTDWKNDVILSLENTDSSDNVMFTSDYCNFTVTVSESVRFISKFGIYYIDGILYIPNKSGVFYDLTNPKDDVDQSIFASVPFALAVPLNASNNKNCTLRIYKSGYIPQGLLDNPEIKTLIVEFLKGRGVVTDNLEKICKRCGQMFTATYRDLELTTIGFVVDSNNEISCLKEADGADYGDGETIANAFECAKAKSKYLTKVANVKTNGLVARVIIKPESLLGCKEQGRPACVKDSREFKSLEVIESFVKKCEAQGLHILVLSTDNSITDKDYLKCQYIFDKNTAKLGIFEPKGQYNHIVSNPHFSKKVNTGIQLFNKLYNPDWKALAGYLKDCKDTKIFNDITTTNLEIGLKAVLNTSLSDNPSMEEVLSDGAMRVSFLRNREIKGILDSLKNSIQDYRFEVQGHSLVLSPDDSEVLQFDECYNSYIAKGLDARYRLDNLLFCDRCEEAELNRIARRLDNVIVNVTEDGYYQAFGVGVKYPSQESREYVIFKCLSSCEIYDRMYISFNSYTDDIYDFYKNSLADYTVKVSNSQMLRKALAGFDFDIDKIQLITDKFLVEMFTRDREERPQIITERQ